MKKENEHPSIGIVVVACLNFLFAIVAVVLASSAMPFSTLLAGPLFVKGASLLVSGIGPWKLKLWALFLTVMMCLVGLIEFALYPNAIPLELLVLPYLLVKKGILEDEEVLFLCMTTIHFTMVL